MIYILSDRLLEGYWFGRYPTLELARREAYNFPKAVHILEYKNAGTKPSWIIPTGRSFPIDDDSKKGE